MKLDVTQIQKYLPHRPPFLFVDRVLECEPGKRILASKCVSVAEPYLSGHFPGNPVVPGVIQIEAMGQAGALLGLFSGAEMNDEQSIYVTSITDCKFKRPVVPGDVMLLEATVLRRRLGMWRFACKAHVGDALASQAVITATVAKKLSTELPEGLPPPPSSGV